MRRSMFEKNKCDFFGIMRVMRSGPNYAISHPRVIPEALVSGAMVI